MKYHLLFLAFLRFHSNAHCLQLSPIVAPSLTSTLWIRREIANITPLKQHFKQILSYQNISLSKVFTSRGPLDYGTCDDIGTPQVAISSLESPYECRLKLGTVMPGKKVVAPCKCTGTQKVGSILMVDRHVLAPKLVRYVNNVCWHWLVWVSYHKYFYFL